MEEKIAKCFFCNKSSKYTCPQCLVRYCSTDCYKCNQHLECSENFYKEQVFRELKDMRGTADEKCKIMKMLMGMQKSNNTNVEDISERLRDVCLNDTDGLWDKLTKDEQATFLRNLQSGNFSFISDWQPWWDVKRPKVVDISDKSSEVVSPKILKNIPDLKDMLSKSPSINLQYNIIEVILVYAYSLRLHNGDLYDYPEDSLDIIFSLSKSLSQNHMFDSLPCVIYSFTENINKKSLANGSFIPVYLKDTELILLSKDHYLLALLSDLYRFFKWSKKHFPVELRMVSTIYKTMKKILFYIAFTKQFYNKISEQSNELYLIRRKMLEDSKIIQEQCNDIEANIKQLRLKQQVLIEEIH